MFALSLAVVGFSQPGAEEPNAAINTIEIPLRFAKTVEFADLVVPPVDRSDPTLWISGGKLNADKFPQVVLSLQGLVNGNVTRSGEVGAVLIPDEQAIRSVLEEQGILQFALEVNARNVSHETPYFASRQLHYTLGFEAYEVLLYNTTDRAVTVNLFAHLTN